MIRLNLSTSARWITLLPGLRIHIAPITTAVMASARSDIAASELPEGLPKEELAVVMAKAVARRVISDWEGVGDEEGVAVSVTPEGIDALLDVWPVFEAFQAQCLAPHLVLDSEKNVSAPSPNGTSEGATDTAKPARGRARTAPQG
jgi:hypothetical protein